MNTRAHADLSQADSRQAASGCDCAVIAALAGVAAAWAAAGSLGLLAHPLQKAVTFTALAAAVLVLPVPTEHRNRRLALGAATAILVAAMVACPLQVVNILASALVLAFLASLSTGRDRSVLLSASTATAVLGVYRLAYAAIPSVWLAADVLGRSAGWLAGTLSGRPLNVGPTFAGLDFLVAMFVLCGVWTGRTCPPRGGRLLYGLAAIVGGHLCYLVLLSFVPEVLAAIPSPPEPSAWSWTSLVRKGLPWNVPVLAGAIHFLIATAMFRWSPQGSAAGPAPTRFARSAPYRWTRHTIVLSIAVLLPIVTSLHPVRPDLQGTKIVFCEKGFLNWLKPTHGSYGRLSSGMYGMLPAYLQSLGAEAVISPDLSPEDLQGADAVVLLFPDEPWAQGQLERVWAFVRRGGSLLVLGEHTTREPDGTNRFNEAVAPTGMRVAFDSATFAVGGWLHSYETMLHPATAGIADDRNQFGVVIGASLEAGLRGHPIIVGRWGWSDWGDEGSSRAMLGSDRYDPGERLGDLLLAAEQRMGKGKIILFGDTSSLTNGINVSSHVFTSRLFAYLANGSTWAHPLWRQVLGLLLAAATAALVIRCLSVSAVTLIALGLAGSLTAVLAVTDGIWQVLPDGRSRSPNNLAYIDTSHLEAFSGESWRGDGVGGLILTLMRNDYLTLSMPRLDSERLRRAGLLVSIAPRRSFSRRERAAVRDFVDRGGVLVLMAGYEDAGPSRGILSDFGFTIADDSHGAREPVPMGHFKSPYLRSGDKRVFVRFHAAWPVVCEDPQAQVLVYGKDNLPVVIMRRVGAGKVVVVADTCFAANDNLEREDGQPFEGLRENADFWRWFITVLREEPAWVPPALRDTPEDETAPPGEGIP